MKIIDNLKVGGGQGFEAGFTLIELLVVIAVIGILSSMVLAQMRIAKVKARDADRVSDMKSLMNAQEMYMNEVNNYSTSDIYPSSIGTVMANTPRDPIDDGTDCGTDYVYCTIDNSGAGNSQKYCYYATLESGKFFVVSHGGSSKVNSAPTTLDECADFSR